MESHPGIEAVRKLAHLGYRFTVNNETIKAKYYGPGEPDSAKVRQLFETVRANKPEAIHFLKSCCPKCGGVFFGTFSGVSRCMACYREE
jgi:hypothetical protein